ncbi:MAG: hypothetical protein KC635_29560, partial [Myxococcales bacterium]|nr:hypothetical protein [Myxococcales bacterium]
TAVAEDTAPADTAVACACAHGTCAEGSAACAECDAGYAGADCAIACPVDEETGGPGCVHGTCDDGVDGAGTCLCDAPYAGTLCSICSADTMSCGDDECLAPARPAPTSPGPTTHWIDAKTRVTQVYDGRDLGETWLGSSFEVERVEVYLGQDMGDVTAVVATSISGATRSSAPVAVTGPGTYTFVFTPPARPANPNNVMSFSLTWTTGERAIPTTFGVYPSADLSGVNPNGTTFTNTDKDLVFTVHARRCP